MAQPLGPPRPPNADETFSSMNHALTKTVPRSLINAKRSILSMRKRRKRF
jgi:hypothetical protein